LDAKVGLLEGDAKKEERKRALERKQRAEAREREEAVRYQLY
jgi:hypothetical protein